MEDIVSGFKSIGMDWTKIVVFSNMGNWLGLNHKFAISPKEFLRYAKTDYKGKDTRALINALSNAKRAMDCQVDLFIQSIGLKHSGKFPAEVDNYIKINSTESNGNKNYRLIEALGVSPAGLIGRYRELRNKLEHFYETPDSQLVKESIELAELLISTIDNAMRSFSFSTLTSGKIDTDDTNGALHISYSSDAGELELEFYSQLKFDTEEFVSKVVLTPEHCLYMPLMKTCLLVGTEIGWDIAVIELIAAINPNIPPKSIYPVLEYA
ncbi:hypothetical protein [Photobacterium indicum]|uniref:hypothetical protein n=1 Tax=Photobacterium indicum TaxID=81447 RepID=UPI003D1498E9